MPTNGITDMFLPYTPNDALIFQSCNTTWGVTPRPNWEEMTFWGADISSATNIFITNGQIDPWRGGGIQTCPKCEPSIVVRLLEGAAHHLDLRASNDLDPVSVVMVREEERKVFNEWIKEWRMRR